MESTAESYPTPRGKDNSKNITKKPFDRPDFTTAPPVPQIPQSEYVSPSQPQEFKIPEGLKGSTPGDSPWFDGLDKPQMSQPTPVEQQPNPQSIYSRLKDHEAKGLIQKPRTELPKQSIFDRLQRLIIKEDKPIK